MLDRTVEKDQWYDPCILMSGNGNETWARWATKWLYEGLADPKDSKNWEKNCKNAGVISQFDRVLSFPGIISGQAVPNVIPTNGRNCLLLARSFRATTISGIFVPNGLFDFFDVRISVPSTTLIMENQPASLTFGEGRWPHVLYLPEEWAKNVSRTVTVTCKAPTDQAYNVFIELKLLQVRSN